MIPLYLSSSCYQMKDEALLKVLKIDNEVVVYMRSTQNTDWDPAKPFGAKVAQATREAEKLAKLSETSASLMGRLGIYLQCTQGFISGAFLAREKERQAWLAGHPPLLLPSYVTDDTLPGAISLANFSTAAISRLAEARSRFRPASTLHVKISGGASLRFDAILGEQAGLPGFDPGSPEYARVPKRKEDSQGYLPSGLFADENCPAGEDLAEVSRTSVQPPRVGSYGGSPHVADPADATLPVDTGLGQPVRTHLPERGDSRRVRVVDVTGQSSSWPPLPASRSDYVDRNRCLQGRVGRRPRQLGGLRALVKSLGQATHQLARASSGLANPEAFPTSVAGHCCGCHFRTIPPRLPISTRWAGPSPHLCAIWHWTSGHGAGNTTSFLWPATCLGTRTSLRMPRPGGATVTRQSGPSTTR